MFFRRKPRKPAARTLGVEALEDRSLPSVSPAAPVIDLSGLSVNTQAYNPSDILVEFKTATGPNAPAALAGTTLGQPLSLVSGLYEVNLSSGVSVGQALSEYNADAQVLKAQPDYLLSTSAVPNDPLFAKQWDLNNTGQDGGTPGAPGADIRAEQAWNVTTGGAKVLVAVMDTGIDYTHPDLYDSIWINQAEIPASRMKNLVDVYHDGYISMRDLNNPVNWGPYKIEPGSNGVVTAAQILAPMVLNAQGQDTGQGGWAFAGNTRDGDTAHPNDFIGWNFVTNTNNPYDDNGHGTHVSGTIAAGMNNGIGTAGIASNVELMAVKFLGADGSGSIGSFIAGLNYAIDHGARISNNSWSGATNSSVLYDALANARAHGQIIVAAAGNSASNNDVNPVYPSAFNLDNVVSVAATDPSGGLASFSNYGAKSVDLGAPGVDILSTLPGATYGLLSGTSMAAPHVTAVMALVWGQHPGWTYNQVIAQVLTTATRDPNLVGKTTTGGVVNAAAAVGGNVTVSVVAPSVTASSAGGPSAGTLDRVRLTFSAAMNASTLPGAIRLLGPSGALIPITGVQAVANTGGKVFDVLFGTQTAAGAYKLTVTPLAYSAAGLGISTYQATYTLVAPPPPVVVAPQVTASSAGGPSAGTLDRVRLTFSAAMNASTLPGAIRLLGPSGALIPITGVQAVANTGGKVFDVLFGTQTAAGAYKLTVTPLAYSAAGLGISTYQATYTLVAPSTPPVVVAPRVTSSSAGGPSSGTLNRVRLTFSDSMNATTLPGAIRLVGPSGALISITGVQAVANTGGKVFDVLFPTQTTPGAYKLTVTPLAYSTAGLGISTYQSTYTIPPPSAASLPLSTTSTAQLVLVPGAQTQSSVVIGSNVRVGTVTVRLNITYPRVGDLKIYLQAPDGTTVLLVNHRGGWGANFQNTVFSDQAGTPIQNAQAPFAGTFRPESPLSALAGKNGQGIWKLWVEDVATGVRGTLNNWSLTITPAVGTASIASVKQTADDVFASATAMSQLATAIRIAG